MTVVPTGSTSYTFTSPSGYTLEATGPYRDLLDTFFPEETEYRKQALWYTFLQNNHITPPVSDTSTSTIAQWGKYLVTADAKIFPSGSAFDSAINDILGTTTSSQDRQELWLRFLSGLNYSFNPISGDQHATGEFLRFLEGIIQDRNQAVTLSPTTRMQNDILMNTFELLIKMIALLQNTTNVHTQNVVYLTKAQDVLTKAIAKVPIYTANGGSNFWNVDTTDLSKWTLGYDNISIADMCDYAAQNRANGDTSTFFFTNANVANESYTNILTNSTIGDVFLKVTFSPGDTTTGPSVKVETYHYNSSTTMFEPLVTTTQNSWTATWTTTQADSMTPTQLSQQMQSAWLDLWNGNSTPTLSGSNAPTLSIGSQTVTVNSNQTTITSVKDWYAYNLQRHADTGAPNPTPIFAMQWPYTGTDATNTQLRTEANTISQQYITNLTAQRDAAKSRTDTMQNALDRDKTQLSELINLIQSFSDTIKGLISAIYR